MESEQVRISLDHDEALVLFEFLSVLIAQQDEAIDDLEQQANQTVINSLICSLERVLVEPFCSDYDMKLEQARKRLTADKD